MKRIYSLLLGVLSAVSASATDYYVSVGGKDTNDGLSASSAFATLTKAQQQVAPGDKVYIEAGTYRLTDADITATGNNGLYSIVFDMNVSGTAGHPISYIGVTDPSGRRPVFDFSGVRPQTRITGFLVEADHLVFRDIEATGLQVLLTGHTQSENFRISNGSHNTFENVSCHDGMGIGFYLQLGSAYNLFVNCDAYNNYDPISEGGAGGNTDGFGCHVQAGSKGNTFIGCRAWANSDDGFDLINCYAPVTFEYCYAYKNGYSWEPDGTYRSRGDGNGFKAGGFGMGATDAGLPAAGAPMHEVHHNVAAFNKSNGIYSNHHLGGIFFHHNTAYKNGRYNYCMVNRRGSGATDNVDVNGYGHVIEHNLAYGSTRVMNWVNGDRDSCTVAFNSFAWDAAGKMWVDQAHLSDADFENLEEHDIMASRQADGFLSAATLSFLRLKSNADYGADFSGYQTAVAEARETVGAEVPAGEGGVSETTIWDFSDLSDGTLEQYTNYQKLWIRGTAGSHAITVKGHVLSFAANGTRIEPYLARDRKADADDGNTNFDRCLAFDAEVAGTCTVSFGCSRANSGRVFQIFFKAPGQPVVKQELVTEKGPVELQLTSTVPGTFFIAGTLACTVSSVKFQVGGTTGIHSVTHASADNAWYDLQGRRVSAPGKGIYIHRGRKVIRR